MKIQSIKKKLYSRIIPLRLLTIKKLQGLAKIDPKNAAGMAKMNNIKPSTIGLDEVEKKVVLVKKKDGTFLGWFTRFDAEQKIAKAKSQKQASLTIDEDAIFA